MRKMIVFCAVSLLALSGYAQGIAFRDLSFNKALAAARQEGKYVFVDCYTDWCGPCKTMAVKVFPSREVGGRVNSRFVSIQVDMEKGEGPALGERFDVKAYPTFLVLDASGKLVHKFGGASDEATFLSRIESAFEENGPAAMRERYEAGVRDTAFLHAYMDMLIENLDPAAAQVAGILLGQLGDDEKISKYGYVYLRPRLFPVGSPEMEFLMANTAKFGAAWGKPEVSGIVTLTCMDYYNHLLRSGGAGRDLLADLDLNSLGLDAGQVGQFELMREGLRLFDTGDFDAFAAKFDRLAPSMNGNQLNSAVLNYDIVFDRNPEWKARWAELSSKYRNVEGAGFPGIMTAMIQALKSNDFDIFARVFEKQAPLLDKAEISMVLQTVDAPFARAPEEWKRKWTELSAKYR